MNIKKSILALTAAVTMVTAATAPAGVRAATAYTAVAGTSFTFNKYFIMDAGDTVPNVTFKFTVAPGEARSASTASNTVMQVLPGEGTPTIADITFTNQDTTTTEVGTHIDVARNNKQRGGAEGADAVQFDSGEKYAMRTGTVSFSGIRFNEPGIYRYVITETANAAHAAAGVIHDTDVDRILDVYVTDNGSGVLVVSAYVLHTENGDVAISDTMGSADVASAAAALEDKTDGFTNEYTSKDLVFKKEVTGNQASRDKYFEFTAKMTNLNDNDVFIVSLSDDGNKNTTDGNADATTEATAATRTENRGKTNPTSVTGAMLKAGQKFYLQHGQSVAIRGLALDAGYTITENAEDYKSTGAVVTGHTDATSGTMGAVANAGKSADSTHKVVMTSFRNQRAGIIPTGIATGSALIAGAVVTVCAAAIAMILYRKARPE